MPGSLMSYFNIFFYIRATARHDKLWRVDVDEKIDKKDKYVHRNLSQSRIFKILTPITWGLALIFALAAYLMRGEQNKKMVPDDGGVLISLAMANCAWGTGSGLLLYIFTEFVFTTPYMMMWSNGGTSDRPPERFRKDTEDEEIVEDLRRLDEQERINTDLLNRAEGQYGGPPGRHQQGIEYYN
ncbi:hypothetical protein OQA88_10779 [Cercophora sp. LCS_1]